MAKTLAKIARPSIKGLKEQLREYRDGYEAARGDVALLQGRIEDLRKSEDRAFSQYGEWKDRCQKVEADNRTLEKDRDRLRERLTIVEANVERLQGWVDCKMNREPRLESEIPF